MTGIRVKKKVSEAFTLEADFSLGAGITALIGPAGAGKTLLLEMVAGLATPDEGRILLDDAILFDGQARVDLPPVRRGCGYVSQTDSLFPIERCGRTWSSRRAGFRAWSATAAWPKLSSNSH